MNVTIPAKVFEDLLETADPKIAEIARLSARTFRDIEDMPKDGTPVLFRTAMTLRYTPYVVARKKGEGRFQWFDPRGQWIKLDEQPEGDWMPLR